RAVTVVFSSASRCLPPRLRPSSPPRRSSDLFWTRPRGPCSWASPRAPRTVPSYRRPCHRRECRAQRQGTHHHAPLVWLPEGRRKDRKSTRLNSSHVKSSYAVFCLKKKKIV